MKTVHPFIITTAIASLCLVTSGHTDAAYIIATDGSLGAGHYAYTGPGGTSATASTASVGQLPATTDSPATFFTLGHVYGGNSPTLDQYTFTYSPGTDGDNTTFTAGTTYNLPQGLSSSGLLGGGAGFYNIYRLHPGNPNVTAGNTATYEVLVNAGFILSQTINQNAANLATGENIGRWELIGNVALSSPSDVLTVNMTPNGNPIGFVSMRASGIMVEYIGPIPEPSSTALLALGAITLLRRRRR